MPNSVRLEESCTVPIPAQLRFLFLVNKVGYLRYIADIFSDSMYSHQLWSFFSFIVITCGLFFYHPKFLSSKQTTIIYYLIKAFMCSLVCHLWLPIHIMLFLFSYVRLFYGYWYKSYTAERKLQGIRVETVRTMGWRREYKYTTRRE